MKKADQKYAKVADGEAPVDSAIASAKSPKREDMDLRSIGSWTEVDWCICAGLFLNVFTKGSVGVYETLGVQVAVTDFGFIPSQAGYIVSTCGAIGVITLLFMKPIVDVFHDTKLMVGGIAVMVLSCFLLIDYGVGPLNTWRFYVAIFCMYASGYPIGTC